MNLKSTLRSTVAVAAVVAGATLAVSPAHALSVGSQLSFTGGADAQTSSINFYNSDFSAGAGKGEFFTVAGTTGDFATLPKNFLGVLTKGTIKDLSSFPLGSDLTQFITFAGAAPKFNFTLQSFAYVANTDFSGYLFNGVFGDGSKATGSISTPVIAPGVLAYSGILKVTTPAAVPTPALLPGLLALGAGVLRKRKSAVAETAETNA